MKLLFAKTLALLVVSSLAHTGEGRGAMFTRWGRNDCPVRGELVYKGYAGGSWYAHHGGGANYLCMPEDPQHANMDTASGFEGIVYGAEYQTSTYSPFENRRGSVGLHDHGVPCAVCRSKRSISTLMVPARTDCYTGWKFEYSGYLMSGHHLHPGRTEYICMDADPRRVAGSYANHDGALFYPVKSHRGSLPCPPYIHQAEVTCVVCSHY